MKIVKFDNGKYALRKWRPFRYVYRDLEGGGRINWRTMENAFFKDCLADSEEEVRQKANLFEVVEKIKV